MSKTLPSDSNAEPAPQRQSVRERVAEFVMDDVLKMPSVPEDKRLAKLTSDQKAQLDDIIDRSISGAQGQLDELESALGMLLIGHHFGWKVLYLVHSKRTIRKYEDILGIKIREIFPEIGPSSPRSVGLAVAEKYPNFWKVVSGEIKIPRRREVE